MDEVNRSPPPTVTAAPASCGESTTTKQPATAAASLWRRLMRKLSYRHLARLFTNADTSALIDALHKLLVAHYGGCVAEKVTRGLLKVVAKLAYALGTGECIHQRRLLLDLDRRFHRLTLTLLSFHRIQYSYDYGFLLAEFTSLKRPVMELIHSSASGGGGGGMQSKGTTVIATSKWVRRTEFLFEHLSGKTFLSSVFEEGGGDTTREVLVAGFFRDLERFLSTSL